MIKKLNIEWRKSTEEELKNGASEMTKEKEFFSYHDSVGNKITEEEYKKQTTLRFLKIIS